MSLEDVTQAENLESVVNTIAQAIAPLLDQLK
jgi:hypothetical protein